MTYFNDTHRPGTLLGGFDRLIDAVRNAYAYRTTYYATLRELESLNRRELDDLGISPARMHDIAASAAEEEVARRA